MAGSPSNTIGDVSHSHSLEVYIIEKKIKTDYRFTPNINRPKKTNEIITINMNGLISD
jgi:hypothetical protein